MRKNDTNIRVLKLLFSFCPSYFPLFVMQSFFGRLSPYFNLYLSAEIVNEIAGAKNADRLMLLVLITLAGNLLISVIGGILNRTVGHKETLLFQREAEFYNKKTLMLDYDDLENTDVRQLRRKITESAMINGHGKQLLFDSARRLVNITVSTILSVALGVDMLVRIFAFGFSPLIIVFAVLIVAAAVFRIRYSYHANGKLSALSNKISETMIDENHIDDAVDCYNMGKDVRIYRQDKLILKIRRFTFGLHVKAFRALAEKNFSTSIPSVIVTRLLDAAVHVLVCVYALLGAFGVGSVIKYVGFVQGIIDCITSYFAVFADIRHNTPFAEDYLRYFEIPRKMYMGTVPVEKRAFCDGGDNDYEIEFRDVSFKYPGSDSYALRRVNIRFKVGQRLAVVGMNGSGKTTFIKLMCRLYDPTEGCIMLNGIDIRKYDYDEYLSLFSVVFQDFKLFSFTIGQNIAAASAYDSEKALSCLEAAGLGDRAAEMPNGLETYLYRDFDNDGIEISGGEAQKLALARALYKDAPFIILDEPTASLDPISEYEIYSRFNDIAQDKTTVFISHRLASCRFCDRIAVFDCGSIVQSGTHDELLGDERGKYFELWNAQAQYYV